MTKQKYRVEKKVVEFEFDEGGVRSAYLNGLPPSVIADRFGTSHVRTILNFISDNKQRWLDEARYSRLRSDDRKIVIPRKVERPGGEIIIPISVARTTMQTRYLAEARHA